VREKLWLVEHKRDGDLFAGRPDPRLVGTHRAHLVEDALDDFGLGHF
jgi:hypothetical protein